MLKRVVRNLEASLRELPRSACVMYVNPIHEETLAGCDSLKKFGGTHLYALFATPE